MRLFSLLWFLLSAHVNAGNNADFPPEVVSFIGDREACEHFLGEPYEGESPEMKERREFISESLDIYCAGTDKRLAALRKRYKTSPVIIERLKKYEEKK
jgi:hypothetical protein